MIRFATLTEKSSDHSENQDFVLRALHPSSRQQYLCFLADGQGGRPDGALASRLACKFALEYAKARSREDLALPSTWDEIFGETDCEVRERCDGCTTLIGFALDHDMISGASVGDSKLYLHDSKNRELCELTNRQNKNPPVGGGCCTARHFYLPSPEGNLLAMTDGVWKYCAFDFIQECAAMDDLGEIPAILCQSVMKHFSGNLPDDFTILAASISALK